MRNERPPYEIHQTFPAGNIAERPRVILATKLSPNFPPVGYGARLLCDDGGLRVRVMDQRFDRTCLSDDMAICQRLFDQVCADEHLDPLSRESPDHSSAHTGSPSRRLAKETSQARVNRSPTAAPAL